MVAGWTVLDSNPMVDTRERHCVNSEFTQEEQLCAVATTDTFLLYMEQHLNSFCGFTLCLPAGNFFEHISSPSPTICGLFLHVLLKKNKLHLGR